MIIGYIAADPAYLARYKVHLGNFSDNIFNPTKIKANYQKMHDLISPYVIGPISVETPDATYLEGGAATFAEGLNFLLNLADTRKVQIDDYLD